MENWNRGAGIAHEKHNRKLWNCHEIMSDWLTVVAALIAGSAGVAGGVIPQWFQSDRERQYRTEVAKQAQADRLRDEFITVLRAARGCERVAHELNVVISNETVESRNQRLSGTLAERIKNLLDD